MLWKAFCHNVVRKQQLYKGSGKDVVNLLVSRSYLVVVLNPQILSLPSLSGCYFRACVLISIPQTCYGQRHEGCFITKQITTLSLTTVGSGDLRGQTNMETCKEPITGEHRVSWFEPQGPQKTLTWKHFGQGGGS